MEGNLYINSAKFYDGGNHRNFSEDIEFYKGYLSAGAAILDIGCGTGRAAIEFAKEGYSVYGIDLSEQMLQVFMEKLEELPESVIENLRIEKQDMTNFELGEKFDLIIFPFRVFQALTTDEQRRKCLRCTANHLKFGGRVIINMFNPDHRLLDNFNSLNNLDYEYYDEKLKLNIKRHSIGRGHSSERKTIRVDYIFEIIGDDGQSENIYENLELGYMEKPDADAMFGEYFDIENIYSWWDKKGFDENEKRELIYVLGEKSIK